MKACRAKRQPAEPGAHPLRVSWGAKADKYDDWKRCPRTECPQFSGMVDTRAAIPPIERRVTNR